MKRCLPVLTALALATACNGGAEGSPEPSPDRLVSPSAPPTPPTPPPDTPEPTASGARTVSEQTDDFVFDYAYPAEAGNIPELAGLLDRALDRSRERLARQAARAREDARDNGFPYNKFSSAMDWQVIADLPGWLSMSGAISSYTGGAHGNYAMQTLVWDKSTGRAMRGIDLFGSARALEQALGTRYCDALDALREERGVATGENEGVSDAQRDEQSFPDCPPVDDLIVLVGSSNGRAFDRLTLYAAPYVAGSYAEGAYEVDLDIDQSILGAVKPRYRESFRVRS